MTTTKTTGTRYTPGRTAPDIARLVRADIKAAVTAGALPGPETGLAYRVRSRSYSGGQAVDVHLVCAAATTKYDTVWAYRPATPTDNADGYHRDVVVREDLREVGAALRAIADAYVRAETDWPSDYANVSCWVDVVLGEGGAHLA